MKKFDKTMLSIPYIRSSLFDDGLSEKLLYSVDLKEEARKLTDSINKANRGMFTRCVEVRSSYFEEILKSYSETYDQLLVLGIGLDTKYDKLDFLKDKNIYGIDIAKKDIEWIQAKAGYKTNVSLIEGDLYHIGQKTTIHELQTQGFDTTKKTFIIWEGGSYYLDPSITIEMLAFFRNRLNLVGMTADFLNKEVIEDKKHPNYRMISEVLGILKNSGNQWHGFFNKQELLNYFTNDLKYKFCRITPYEKMERQLYSKEECIIMDDLIFFVTSTDV